MLNSLVPSSPAAPHSALSARVLTDFYIDKLSDVLVLTPALQGLLTLSGLPTFGSSETLALVPACVLRRPGSSSLTCPTVRVLTASANHLEIGC